MIDGVIFLSATTPSTGAEPWILLPDLDFGDAPVTFPVTRSENGARHAPIGPTLGQQRDVESDGAHSNAADSDAADDGILFGNIIVGELMAGVNVALGNASQASVDAWIDFDGDGIWQADEKILDGRLVTDAAPFQTLNYTINADAVAGSTIARVRISTAGHLDATGFAADGEVEDYRIRIVDAPSVERVQIGDGTLQRSIVTSVTVVFDQLVDAPVTAFSIANRDTGVMINSLNVTSSNIDGKTYSVIAFGEGPSIASRSNGIHSLADGNCRLTIDGSQIISVISARPMDGDAVYGDSAVDTFFRLFGDTDAERDVDAQDFSRFGSSFLKTADQAGFNPFLDHDGDGDVDGQDGAHFKKRMLKSLRH